MRKDKLWSPPVLLVTACLAFVLAVVWLGCGDSPESLVGPGSTSFDDGSLGKSSKEVERVMVVQDRHTDALMAKRGVVGTATGLGPDGRLAVLVLTRTDAEIGGFPLRVDDAPLVVMEVGEIVALQGGKGKGKPGGVDPTSRFDRPVPIGVSTGNEGECSAGTIGCRVKRGNEVYALSNNHVYALENEAPVGSDVLQPGRYDTNCGVDPRDVIGQLADFEPIKFDGSNNVMDAAIASTTTNDVGTATPSNGYGTPKSSTVASTLGLAVQKYGRTTASTKGQVAAINVTVNVTYSSGTAKYIDQVIVTSRKPFVKAGDSGSLLVTDPGRNPVGLIFAGSSGGVGIANPIDPVLSRFNVQIDGQ